MAGESDEKGEQKDEGERCRRAEAAAEARLGACYGRIGEALMRRVEQWARDAGYREMRLRSNVIRSGAHAFYRRIGYSTTKTSHIFWKALAG